MSNDKLSPTVVRILDEFADSLNVDADIDNGVVDELDKLLKSGKVPKAEDFDAILFAPVDVHSP
jgi:hypothetical protein